MDDLDSCKVSPVMAAVQQGCEKVLYDSRAAASPVKRCLAVSGLEARAVSLSTYLAWRSETYMPTSLCLLGFCRRLNKEFSRS